MIASLIIVAGVCALGGSFLGIVHYFWLREPSTEQAFPDGRAKEKQSKATVEKPNLRATVVARLHAVP